MSRSKLTKKQEAFKDLIISGTAKEAAYRQVYNCDKMTDASIAREARQLFNHPLITSEFDQIAKIAREKAAVDDTYVLQRLVEIDQMDLCDILNDDWTLKPLTVWPRVWRSYITAVDVQELRAGQSDPDVAVAFLKKIKWPDKLKNLEMLGKHRAIQAFTPEKDKGVIPEFPEVIEIYAYEPDQIAHEPKTGQS
jgi:phage terminase small subunit